MKPGSVFGALAALVMLAACTPADSPVNIPPLGTKAPAADPDAPPPPSRTRISTVSTSCALPEPGKEAEVVVVITARGNAVSNIAVAGQDEETTAVTVNVEPGEAPVYLFVIGGAPIVWAVEGAADRIERMIVQPSVDGNVAGFGVTGLPSRPVSAIRADACGKPYDFAYDKAERLEALKRALRRDDFVIVGIDSIGTVNVPSGSAGPGNRDIGGPTIRSNAGTYIIRDDRPVRVNPKARNFMYKQFQRFYPAGVVMSDPERVLSTRPVEAYDVLPSAAGLIQLVEAGLLVFNPANGAYEIHDEIPRYPAGLAGAHSVNFILKDGVRRPKGKIQHSSLYQGSTGTCLEGICKFLEEARRREQEFRQR